MRHNPTSVLMRCQRCLIRTASAGLAVFLLGGVPVTGTEWLAVDATLRTREVSEPSPDDSDAVAYVQRSAPPTRRGSGGWWLHRRDGAVLPGVPLGTDEDATTLRWRNLMLGEVVVPFADIDRLERTDAARVPIRPILTNDEGVGEDLIRLGNGDVLRGVVLSLDEQTLVLQTGGAEQAVPLSAVRSVLLVPLEDGVEASPADGVTAPATLWRLTMWDGTIWTLPIVSISGQTIRTAAGESVSVALDAVASMARVDGHVVWLATLRPVGVDVVPFLPRVFATTPSNDLPPGGSNRTDGGPPWPTHLGVATVGDRSRTGRPLSDAHAGLRLVPRTSVTYDIPAGVTTFRARLQVPSGDTAAGVNVRVLLDTEVAYEASDLRASTPPQLVDVPVGTARTVRLVADHVNPFGVGAAIDWLDPMFVREGPAVSPPASP